MSPNEQSTAASAETGTIVPAGNPATAGALPPPRERDPKSTESDESRKPKGLAWLSTVIAASAAIVGFLLNYGAVALGIAITGSAILGLFELYKKESFLAWLARTSPTAVKTIFWCLLICGVIVIVIGALTVSNTLDLFRADYGSHQFINKTSYLASSSPWFLPPAAGASSDVVETFELAGWKRLMYEAVLNDPSNNGRQMLYVESEVFTKGYKTFDAEVVLPQTVEIVQLHAFLSRDKSERSVHEALIVLRSDYPIGPDKNIAHVHLDSPDSGETMVIFLVVSPKNKKPLPPDLQDMVSLRSM